MQRMNSEGGIIMKTLLLVLLIVIVVQNIKVQKRYERRHDNEA